MYTQQNEIFELFMHFLFKYKELKIVIRTHMKQIEKRTGKVKKSIQIH